MISAQTTEKGHPHYISHYSHFDLGWQILSFYSLIFGYACNKLSPLTFQGKVSLAEGAALKS